MCKLIKENMHLNYRNVGLLLQDWTDMVFSISASLLNTIKGDDRKHVIVGEATAFKQLQEATNVLKHQGGQRVHPSEMVILYIHYIAAIYVDNFQDQRYSTGGKNQRNLCWVLDRHNHRKMSRTTC